jgi:hypothetical protein
MPFNHYLPWIIDTDPDDPEFFSLWTNVPDAINAEIAGSIGDRENAELIVRAVNSHAALVEALTLAATCLDQAAHFATLAKEPEESARFKNDAAQMRAALRLAGEDVFMKQPIPTYYECGCCGAMHSALWDGDCREQGSRLDVDQLDASHGPNGWAEIDMMEVDEWRKANGLDIELTPAVFAGKFAG